MSSSTDAVIRRTRIVRDTPVQTLAALQDLDALSGAALRAIDPDALADALAQGYADGHAEGYAAGLTAGRDAAIEAADRLRAADAAALAAALHALAAAAVQVLDRRDETVAAMEDELVSGAFELAEAVVGRELQLAESPGRDALARALRLVEGTAGVVVRMHPDDVATLGDPGPLAPGRDVTIVADPAVERGGCLAQVGDGCVDARIGAALDRVREVLVP